MVVIIKMKGLPWEATAREIRKFYRGLSISEEDIHLAPSQEGKASGFAFACFQEDDEARKAMYRNGNYVGKRYIELVLSSQSEMEKTLSEGVRFRRFDGSERERVPEIETFRIESLKTKSNGLRESSKITRDVPRRSRSRSPIRKSTSLDGFRSRRDHSGSNHMSDRRAVKKFNDRESLRSTNSSANGVATTRNELDRRTRERERDRRRSSDRSELGKITASYGRDREGRGTRLETSTSGARQEASNGFRRESFSSNNRSRRESASQDGANSKSTWVTMSGLPYSVTESEIRQFFSGLNVVSIHLMVHASGPFAGKNNGHAYVEFKSVGDCIQGENRNRQFIRRRYCGVKRCSLEEVLSTLGDKTEDTWRFQEPNNIIGGNFSQEGAMYSLGNMNGEDQNLSTPDLGMAVNSLGVNSVGKMPIPHSAVMGMEGPLNPVNQLAAGANISVNDISAGCVIGIRNLPSTVSAEEILDFFYGFPIIPDSIRIHYLAPGRSSGDAMVTLPTSGEAYSAIEQLNNKPVGKRKVQLFLV